MDLFFYCFHLALAFIPIIVSMYHVYRLLSLWEFLSGGICFFGYFSLEVVVGTRLCQSNVCICNLYRLFGSAECVGKDLS